MYRYTHILHWQSFEYITIPNSDWGQSSAWKKAMVNAWAEVTKLIFLFFLFLIKMNLCAWLKARCHCTYCSSSGRLSNLFFSFLDRKILLLRGSCFVGILASSTGVGGTLASSAGVLTLALLPAAVLVGKHTPRSAQHARSSHSRTS